MNVHIKRLAALFSRQIAGVSKEKREARLLAIERIAASVRARRSTEEGQGQGEK